MRSPLRAYSPESGSGKTCLLITLPASVLFPFDASVLHLLPHASPQLASRDIIWHSGNLHVFASFHVLSCLYCCPSRFWSYSLSSFTHSRLWSILVWGTKVSDIDRRGRDHLIIGPTRSNWHKAENLGFLSLFLAHNWLLSGVLDKGNLRINCHLPARRTRFDIFSDDLIDLDVTGTSSC